MTNIRVVSNPREVLVYVVNRQLVGIGFAAPAASDDKTGKDIEDEASDAVTW